MDTKMNYSEAIKTLAALGVQEDELIEDSIKAMSTLIVDLLNYRYMKNNYKTDGNSNVLESYKVKINKDITWTITDIDVYMKQTGVSNVVKKLAFDRVTKMAEKTLRRNNNGGN